MGKHDPLKKHLISKTQTGVAGFKISWQPTEMKSPVSMVLCFFHSKTTVYRLLQGHKAIDSFPSGTMYGMVHTEKYYSLRYGYSRHH